MTTTPNPHTPPATLTVYSKPGCVQCRATTRALDKAGVSYAVVDLTTDDDARAYVMALGHRQAPVVVTETGDHWSGYRPDQITAHLQRQAASRA
ncbi:MULTISPECIES: glutaredoxin-like protein NrdH [Cellulomonas]|uniref:Glutaredoxin-like protein NrdH n=1 Tax=Cellulomonas denverensis TaxID=264297 RepID=A0A7X6KYH0_9CELL|nr:MULTISPECIES: glutaredoxin-like protein NrdH [Cellulomonas]NKY24407.1 glutaredoxin-like protein NrdH [Cellulomonas denverensis]QZN87734.1 glutaredoxin-like protein NrdH [Cellulomonas sp. C5510]